MQIDLKKLINQQIGEMPGSELEAFILMATDETGISSCGIVGESAKVKAMLCNILDHDGPRQLFEECYSYVLARRAGLTNPDKINPNNN